MSTAQLAFQTAQTHGLMSAITEVYKRFLAGEISAYGYSDLVDELIQYFENGELDQAC
jgi:hypothetical protein